MSAASRLLDRLQRPRQVAPGKWMAACPCCNSKRGRPVAVRELDDGRVLLHAFCGCSTEAVLAAMGLSLADLYERPLGHHLAPTVRPALSAREALELAEHESLVVAILAHDVSAGRELTPADAARLGQAAARIGALREATRHG